MTKEEIAEQKLRDRAKKWYGVFKYEIIMMGPNEFITKAYMKPDDIIAACDHLQHKITEFVNMDSKRDKKARVLTTQERSNLIAAKAGLQLLLAQYYPDFYNSLPPGFSSSEDYKIFKWVSRIAKFKQKMAAIFSFNKKEL